MTMGLQGYGQPQDWQDDMYYPVGQTVVDRGGIWRAVAANRNSEPISGNADWTLVAGTPYVDVTLSPVDLTTTPFFDAGASGPGVELIPAPGAGLRVNPMWGFTLSSDGDAWGIDGVVDLAWGSPAGQGITSTYFNGGSPMGATLQVGFPANGPLTVTGYNTSDGGSPDTEDLPVVMWTTQDVTTGATGTRSLLVRVYYDILPMTSTTFATFFTITAVDQGTQTFTVNGDATGDIAAGDSVSVVGSTLNNGDYTVTSATATSALDITAVDTVGKKFTVAGDQTPFFVATDSAVVAGSTGNDGTYTVVSATFVAGTHTDIVVVEVILDATVDGTIEDSTMRTAIITVGAIPDSTADGWVEVA